MQWCYNLMGPPSYMPSVVERNVVCGAYLYSKQWYQERPKIINSAQKVTNVEGSMLVWKFVTIKVV